MERFKKILKKAISAKGMRLKMTPGALIEIITPEGPKQFEDEGAIDPAYFQSLLGMLFGKPDQDSLQRGAPTRGIIQAAPVGKIFLLAERGEAGPLKIYFPPQGEAMFNQAWEELRVGAPTSENLYRPEPYATKIQPIPIAPATSFVKEPPQEINTDSNARAPGPLPFAATKPLGGIKPEIALAPIPAPGTPSAPEASSDSQPMLDTLPKNAFNLAYPPRSQEPKAGPPKFAPIMTELNDTHANVPPPIQPSTPSFKVPPSIPMQEGGTLTIDKLLREMVQRKASDLHLTTGEPVVFRVDGEITRTQTQPITAEDMERFLRPILPKDNEKEFQDTWDTDFAYELAGSGRFRVNLFRDRLGVGMVLRHIPSRILTAEELKLPAAITQFCKLSKGLVVVTGPTGSGKSTTLAAMVDLINKTRHDHILTIEDPIEFVHPQQKCLVNQREVSKHTRSFARALKAALREDPDIILIGEMRDLETVAIAIETAETGHLVFGTLHTTTAVSTIDRIVDQFPADRQEQIRMMVSSSLKGVVAQTLLKKKTGGRVAAHEVLVVTDPVSAMIREGKNHMIQNHMTSQKQDGNELLNDALVNLVLQNIVSAEDAFIKAVAKKELVAAMKSKGINVTQLENLAGPSITKQSA